MVVRWRGGGRLLHGVPYRALPLTVLNSPDVLPSCSVDRGAVDAVRESGDSNSYAEGIGSGPNDLHPSPFVPAYTVSTIYVTIPYHTGKACYRLALRPPV